MPKAGIGLPGPLANPTSAVPTASPVPGQPSQEANFAVPPLARSGTPPTVDLAELSVSLAQRVLAIRAQPSASSGLSPTAHASPAARGAAAGLPPTAPPPAIATQVAVLSARSESPPAAHVTPAAPMAGDELPEPPAQPTGCAQAAVLSAGSPPAEHARSGVPKAGIGLLGPLANPTSAVPKPNVYSLSPNLPLSSVRVVVSRALGSAVVRIAVLDVGGRSCGKSTALPSPFRARVRSPHRKPKLKWVEWSLDCRCGASRKRPAKKEGGWNAPRLRLKDRESLLVCAGSVLGLSTHIV